MCQRISLKLSTAPSSPLLLIARTSQLTIITLGAMLQSLRIYVVYVKTKPTD